MLYYKIEDFHKTKNATKKALEIKPDFKNALVFLGLAHAELDELKEALNIYDKLIEMDPLFEKAIGLKLKIQEKSTPIKEI